MKIELLMLAYSVGLLFVLILIQATAGTLTQGLMNLANSRDNLPPKGVFQARAGRTVDNHREGLTLFAPLVLIAAVSGISTELTVLGAQLFFYSRVVHAAVYLAGVPYVRPAVWTVGIVGIGMIFYSLVTNVTAVVPA
jgi:uncharacterized MAPEG superfamily protein